LLRPGGKAVVERVLDTAPETLQRLAEAGLVPGAQVTLVAVDEAADCVSLRVADRSAPMVLPRDLARMLRVVPT